MSVCWCDTSEKAVEGASESGRLERSIADGWKDLKILPAAFLAVTVHVDDRPRAPQNSRHTHPPSTVRRAYTHQMGVVVTPTVPSVAVRPMGRATLRPARSPTRSAVATRALPPANEIAGFVIGAGLSIRGIRIFCTNILSCTRGIICVSLTRFLATTSRQNKC